MNVDLVMTLLVPVVMDLHIAIKQSSAIWVGVASLFMVSCHSSGDPKKRQPLSKMEVKTEVFRFESADVDNLKSYSLTCAFEADSVAVMYAYNYKTHGLDCFNLLQGTVSHIPFAVSGADAVNRSVRSLYVQSPDSIWIYDDSQHALLLDGKGQVRRKTNLRKGLERGEELLIERNYAICTAPLRYDADRQSLRYACQDLSHPVRDIYVCEQPLNDSLPVKKRHLSRPHSVSDFATGTYGNMGGVNLCFTPNGLIYNYPVESAVYVASAASSEERMLTAESNYTPNVAARCKSPQDYSSWIVHTIENPHFYEVISLPGQEMFARLHLGGCPADVSADLGVQMDSRGCYLTLFDAEMQQTAEIELPSRHYDYYTGWCGMRDGILLFADNHQEEESEDETTVIEWIRPTPIPDR